MARAFDPPFGNSPAAPISPLDVPCRKPASGRAVRAVSTPRKSKGRSYLVPKCQFEYTTELLGVLWPLQARET